MATGSIAAATGYYLYGIFNPTTGLGDYLAHTGDDYAAISGDLPSGYTKVQSVGYVRTKAASADLRSWKQVKDYVRWLDALVTDSTVVHDTSITNETFETVTMHGPALALHHVRYYGYNDHSSDDVYVLLKPNGAADDFSYPTNFSREFFNQGETFVMSDAGGVIQYALHFEEVAATPSVGIYEIGFHMLNRGRMPLS